MLSFQSATGNLFNRLGKDALLLKEARACQLAQLTNMTSQAAGVVGQLNSEPDIQAVMGNSYLGLLTGPESVGPVAQQLAQATVNRMVFRDNPRPNQSLTLLNVTGSVQEVIHQMYVQGATVLALTVGATPGPFTGVGNGVLNASTRRAFDGRVLENSFAENLTVVCSRDSYSGQATAGNEPFSVTGSSVQPDLFAFNWPGGSGANTSLSAIDGDVSFGSGNILVNSGFNSWTAGLPNNFTLTVGTLANVSEDTGIVYSGGAALRFNGDGVTFPQIRQLFGSASGTTYSLVPQTQYSFNLWLRVGAVTPADGVLTIDLVDENDNVVNDLAGNPNSYSINAADLNTVYTPYPGSFRTPSILTGTYYLRMSFTGPNPLTNGAFLYADKASMGVMTQAYASGPSLAVHSGSTPFSVGDYALCAVSNSRGAGGSLDTWQTAFARLLDPYVIPAGFLLPSSPTPTVSDALIG